LGSLNFSDFSPALDWPAPLGAAKLKAPTIAKVASGFSKRLASPISELNLGPDVSSVGKFNTSGEGSASRTNFSILIYFDMIL
jgi:hypothetical protein